MPLQIGVKVHYSLRLHAHENEVEKVTCAKIERDNLLENHTLVFIIIYN